MGNVFMKEEITEPIELEFNEELLPICNSQINTVQELRVSVKSIKREPELSVEELEAQTNNEYAQRNCTLIANAFENKKLSVDLPDRSNITVLRDMKKILRQNGGDFIWAVYAVGTKIYFSYTEYYDSNCEIPIPTYEVSK